MKSSVRVFIAFVISFMLGFAISFSNGRSLASALHSAIFFAVLVGIIVAMLSLGIDIAVKKGYPGWVGFFLVFFLNVFGLLLLAALPGRISHGDLK